MMQRTLVLIKPDGVMRGLIGEIIKRFEQRGMKIIGMKMVNVERELADRHYKDIGIRHGEKIKKDLVDYLISGPNVAMVIEGIDGVANVRKITGSTFPNEAAIGTIRGDFAHTSREYGNKMGKMMNLVHASATIEEAKEEINLWFSEDELLDYKLCHQAHVS